MSKIHILKNTKEKVEKAIIRLQAVDTSDSGPLIRFPKHVTPPASPPVEPIKPESETESDSNEKEAPVQKNPKIVLDMKNLCWLQKWRTWGSFLNEKVDILIYDFHC